MHREAPAELYGSYTRALQLRAMHVNLGWAWEVQPCLSSSPLIAVGHADTQEKARSAAETAMTRAQDAAGWATLAGPGGRQEICRRTRSGGYAWLPAFRNG